MRSPFSLLVGEAVVVEAPPMLEEAAGVVACRIFILRLRLQVKLSRSRWELAEMVGRCPGWAPRGAPARLPTAQNLEAPLAELLERPAVLSLGATGAVEATVVREVSVERIQSGVEVVAAAREKSAVMPVWLKVASGVKEPLPLSPSPCFQPAGAQSTSQVGVVAVEERAK